MTAEQTIEILKNRAKRYQQGAEQAGDVGRYYEAHKYMIEAVALEDAIREIQRALFVERYKEQKAKEAENG